MGVGQRQLKHEWLTSFETATSKAAFQLKQVTRELGKRPLAAYDRGYGNAKFVQATEKIDADLLLRLASNRCVWGTPGTYKGRGAPCKHGHKFKLNDPQTWPVATETLEVEDPKVGRVKVMRWSGFHFLVAKCQLVQTQEGRHSTGKRRSIFYTQRVNWFIAIATFSRHLSIHSVHCGASVTS